MGTENIKVSIENYKRLNLNVNIGQGDEIKVPVTIGGDGGGSCEIDTTELAKQGENQEATNSAILKAVSTISDTKNLYSARFDKNDDGIETYTMVLPIVSGEIANEDGTITIQL